MPPELGRLTALEAVSLHKNRLTRVPPEMLLGLAGGCCRLSLYENQLIEVGYWVGDGWPRPGTVTNGAGIAWRYE